MQDYQKTIIAQYSDSPTLTQLITNLNTCLDPNANLQRFYDLIWNVDTAVGYGLDVWGRIVGVNRVIASGVDAFFGFFEALDSEGWGTGDSILPPVPAYFGFAEDPYSSGFGVECFADFGVPDYPNPADVSTTGAPFYAGEATTINVTLDDESFRLLIFAKASSNITDGSIRSINAILMNLFPLRGNAYVIDGANNPLYLSYFGFAEDPDSSGWDQEAFADFGADIAADIYFGFAEANSWEGFGLAPFYGGLPFLVPTGNMTMSYVFNFHLEPVERDIVIGSGALPKPVGVLPYIYYL